MTDRHLSDPNNGSLGALEVRNPNNGRKNQYSERRTTIMVPINKNISNTADRYASRGLIKTCPSYSHGKHYLPAAAHATINLISKAVAASESWHAGCISIAIPNKSCWHGIGCKVSVVQGEQRYTMVVLFKV